jgi:Bacterial protein of unknown function (DUF899)
VRADLGNTDPARCTPLTVSGRESPRGTRRRGPNVGRAGTARSARYPTWSLSSDLRSRGATTASFWSASPLVVRRRRVQDVYHTYSTFGRGIEEFHYGIPYLDLTALGRQESWEQPKGRATPLGLHVGGPRLRFPDEYDT